MDRTADILFQYLKDALYSPQVAVLDLESLPEDFKKLGQGLQCFIRMVNEARDFARALGSGNLSVPPPAPLNEFAAPLKGLHASLRHLTWQSQQVALGDYSQRVDFMGDFSVAFNAMIVQLEERQNALVEEIERGREKAQALEQSNNLFEALTEKIAQYIVVDDAMTGDRLFLNGAAREVMARDAESCAVWREWLTDQGESMRLIDDARMTEVELVFHGESHICSVAAYPTRWWGRRAVAYVIADVSREKRRQQELEIAANIDPLTGLFSRRYGMRLLREWLKRGKAFCLCFTDLDNLKFVNDQYGHAEGDRYIIDAASLLDSFGDDAVAARLGGDEMMVLAEGWSEAHAAACMQEVSEALSAADGPEYTRSISFGVVEVAANDPRSQGELLSIADERMYRNKRERKQQRQG